MEKKWLSKAEQKELQMILTAETFNPEIFGGRETPEGVVRTEYKLLETLDIAKALRAKISKDNDSVIVSKVFSHDNRKLILNFNESWVSVSIVDKKEEGFDDQRPRFDLSIHKDLYAVYYTPKYWIAIVSYPFIICINRKCLDIQILWPYSRK